MIVTTILPTATIAAFAAIAATATLFVAKAKHYLQPRQNIICNRSNNSNRSYSNHSSIMAPRDSVRDADSPVTSQTAAWRPHQRLSLLLQNATPTSPHLAGNTRLLR